MNIRAAIFDIYSTLLEVGPPPADAARRWEGLCQTILGQPARLSLAEFDGACGQLIAREHAAARALGISHPEVYWPAIAAAALPELARLPAKARDEFLFQQAQLKHTVHLKANAAEGLRALDRAGILLGLASNSQPYTLRELDDALGGAGLTRALFTSALCFFSFEHGFSKPDPLVFRWLIARLRILDIQAADTLVVGDRLDDDIEPARAQGLQTWQLTAVLPSGRAPAGDWISLVEWIRRSA